MLREAKFSEDGRNRYWLSRIWDVNKPCIAFIGLNPSTANAEKDDPTIRRVISFATKWGYGGVWMLNCFPFVTAYPKEIAIDYDQFEINERYIAEIGNNCTEVIFAWGNFKEPFQHARDAVLMRMFPNAKALQKNKNGSPKHPLYVKGDVVPVLFNHHK